MAEKAAVTNGIDDLHRKIVALCVGFYGYPFQTHQVFQYNVGDDGAFAELCFMEFQYVNSVDIKWWAMSIIQRMTK